MKFELSVERPGKGEQPVAEADFDNFAAAHEWARSLVAESADGGTPFMRSEDGSIGVKYVQTAGGQWYAIALSTAVFREEHA